MSIVPSLLQAIVHVDGEAMVMHAGDKPYVVSPTGQVDLASRGLTLGCREPHEDLVADEVVVRVRPRGGRVLDTHEPHGIDFLEPIEE